MRVPRIVIACLLGLALLGAGCGDSDSKNVHAGSGAMPAPRVERSQAEQHVRNLKSEFPAINRLESKYATWSELMDAERSSGATADNPGNVPADEPIWIVAASGKFVPSFQPPSADVSYQWGIVILDANDGSVLGSAGGPQGAWPPYWSNIPDHAQ